MGTQDIFTAELWAGPGINTYFFLGAVLLAVTTVSYVRRSRADGRA
ncbi:hypothetical protein ACIBTV_29475 [Micromonospora sp. NPDC049366]